MSAVKNLTLLVLLLFTHSAFALDLEQLFSPGDLIIGHEKAQGDCKNCHVRGRDMSRNSLCLDCHEKVAEDIKLKKGYHSKDAKVSQTDCRECHTDHKGREAKIVILDKDHFNHKLTDYELIGKHQQTVCVSCHKDDKKFREAPSKCIDCHKDDDAHDNKLGDKCESCHNPKAWSSDQFDHDKTKFKLRYAHKKVACDLCHVDNRYKKTPKQCVACHAIKDVHQNRFGKKCDSCHVESEWKKTRFDHYRETKFRLKGSHEKVSCHACHALKDKGKFKKEKPRKCNDCHRLDDIHQGKNGDKCDKCHAEKSWRKTSFNHDNDTEFKLHGAHKKASCQACHQQDIKGKKTDKACYSCHQHQDAHQGEEGEKCNQCHNDSSWWLEDVRFDHDLSSFPLIGQHAVAGCESCHLSSLFKMKKTDCVDCHRQDDVHEKSLGENCQQCHNPNDWLIWQFNHDETDFEIMGAHKEVHCNQCHHEPMIRNKETVRDCIDCHRQDDVHGGNFGSDCTRCHTQDDFTTININ
jgi:hypothetical protein